MTLSDVLIPALRTRFPKHAMSVGTPPDPIAVFQPRCPEIGVLAIFDDGEEATVMLEHITHHHVDNYDQALTAEQRAQWITEGVVGFVEDLFADQVLLWSVQQGQKGGGWLRPYIGDIPENVPDDADVFLWSRRLR